MKKEKITIIRECVRFKGKREWRIILRTNCYGSSLGFFFKLFSYLLQDFPDIKAEDMDVMHYGGRCYKGTYGIEFNVTKRPSRRYRRSREVECIL